MTFSDLLAIYEGSNGEATKALYAELEPIGPIGLIATNLFRAHKASARAKVYRGGERGRGSYRSMAYDRKEWSLGNLQDVLTRYGTELGIAWGWKEDPAQEFHRWVLYVDLPTGQVSFHTAHQGSGPDYSGAWDGVRDQGPTRICMFIARVLERRAA